MKLKPIYEAITKGVVTETVDIQQALDAYVDKLTKHSAERFKKGGYEIESDVFEVIPGKKYDKIAVRNLGGKGQRSVFAFVDKVTGDIYKPAGWNAPAKGVRGNINDANPPLTGRDLYR